MKKIVTKESGQMLFILYALITCLSVLTGCSIHNGPEPGTAQDDIDFIPEISNSETVSTISASYWNSETLESHDIIASYETSSHNKHDKTEIYFFLPDTQPVCDILFSEIYVDEDDVLSEFNHRETGAFLYVPELQQGQVIRIETQDLSEIPRIRIAYTNSNDEYEAVLLGYDEEKGIPKLMPTEAKLHDLIYHEDNFNWQPYFPEDFKEAMLRGRFDSYVPKGFCIAAGSLGDLNDDGIEDALITLTSSAPKVAMYISDVMPLFVLIGQDDGSYALTARNSKALFSPYRSSSIAVAGQGSIDIEYSYVGGASHHTEANFHFPHDPKKNDWFLSEFCYVRMDNNFQKKLEPVAALPHFSGLSITEFSGREIDQMPDFEQFDKVVTIQIPNDFRAARHDIYTIAVNVDESKDTYDGYIYKYFTSINSDSFQRTIHGEYPHDRLLDITVDHDRYAFQIHNDTYSYHDLLDEFFIEAE